MFPLHTTTMHITIIITATSLLPQLSLDSVLRHPVIRSVKRIQRVSQDQLIEALKAHPSFMHEFIAQMKKFRLMAQPYIFKTDSSVSDSTSLNFSS